MTKSIPLTHVRDMIKGEEYYWQGYKSKELTPVIFKRSRPMIMVIKIPGIRKYQVVNRQDMPKVSDVSNSYK